MDKDARQWSKDVTRLRSRTHRHMKEKWKEIDPHVIYTNKSKNSGLNCINRLYVSRVCVHPMDILYVAAIEYNNILLIHINTYTIYGTTDIFPVFGCAIVLYRIR